MRLAVITAALAIACALSVPSARQSPAFFPVALEYTPDGLSPRAEVARDLQAVRASGFNAIKTVVRWREAEPRRGEIPAHRARADPGSRRPVRLARRSCGSTMPRPTGSSRAMLTASGGPNRPRPRARPASIIPASARICLRFVAAAAKAAARHAALLAMDVGSPPPSGCACARTRARARGAAGAGGSRACGCCERISPSSLARPRAGGVQSASHAALPSVIRGSMSAPPGQDDWLMSTTVDRYGTSIDAIDGGVGAQPRHRRHGRRGARRRLVARAGGVGRRARSTARRLDGDVARRPRAALRRSSARRRARRYHRAQSGALRPGAAAPIARRDPVRSARSVAIGARSLAADPSRAARSPHRRRHPARGTIDAETRSPATAPSSRRRRRALPLGAVEALKSFQSGGGALVDTAGAALSADARGVDRGARASHPMCGSKADPASRCGSSSRPRCR